MVIKYLEKLYQDLFEEKLNLEWDIQKKEILLKDNKKFIETLEKSLDDNYESFSPKKMYEENYIKINSLQEEQRKCEEEIRKTKIQIVDLSVKLSELDGVIKAAREDKKQKEIAGESDNQYVRKNILEIQEIERKRIARDMHDTIVQNLANLIHKIEICDKVGEVDPIRCKLELREMTNSIRKIIQEMREIIYDLRPLPFDDVTLEEIIERELVKIKNYGIVNVSYEVEGKSQNLSKIISLTIFRVVQEVCNNILKHAQAKNIRVKVKFLEEILEIYIEDDGKGFDIDAVANFDRKDNSGFGISMMRERIYLLAGKLEINSTIKEGTKILIRVPIIKEEK